MIKECYIRSLTDERMNKHIDEAAKRLRLRKNDVLFIKANISFVSEVEESGREIERLGYLIDHKVSVAPTIHGVDTSIVTQEVFEKIQEHFKGVLCFCEYSSKSYYGLVMIQKLDDSFAYLLDQILQEEKGL